MTEKFQPPRGTKDVLPAEAAVRQRVMQAIRGVFESYGYGEVSTPAFEDFDLLALKAGPDIANEIYVFTDKSDRKLGLRFDMTVPVARVVASTPGLPKPLKYFYIAPMWRYDRPQRGRFREFWQAGIELIGSPRAEADAEILCVVAEALKAAGLKDVTFKVNSRNAVEQLVKDAGIPAAQKDAVFRAIDKLAKIGEKGVIEELRTANVPETSAKKLLVALAEGDIVDAQLDQIIALAQANGVTVQKDASIVRGIGYYTGFVFETMARGKEDLGSVASGGRYDQLIRQYGGEDLPATGFAIGIERVIEAAGLQPTPSRSVLIIPVSDAQAGAARELAQKLRQERVSTETDLMGRTFRKQLEWANSRGFAWVVVMGEKEVSTKTYTLKNMRSGETTELKLQALVDRLTHFI